MSQLLDVMVPDIGEFSDVEIIEVHVAEGDAVAAEDPLITLESDKAAMEVPSPAAGNVWEVVVAVGDRISEGDLILRLGVGDTADTNVAENSGDAAVDQPATDIGVAITAGEFDGAVDLETELLVLGAGPGGYTAAFRAADLGLQVTLVERWPELGGVCLNVGCIPSKALLHAAKVIDEAAEMADCGIQFGEPRIDSSRLVDWKQKIVGRLTGGLANLAKQRKVRVVSGIGNSCLTITCASPTETSHRLIAFHQCIIAAGSEAVQVPDWPDDPRVIDSTGALELADVTRSHARRGWRHHRPRNGDGVCGVRCSGFRRGIDGPAHAGLRQGPVASTEQTYRPALRKNYARHPRRRYGGHV